MTEETWHEARLIPTSGINGAEEQERRATSALLAVMSSVREFGRTLTKPFGAPAGTLETYIEVPFQLAEQRLFPDGLIRASRGKKSWTALVEVKTSNNTLQTAQIENYLDIAKENGFDALITISNEIAPVVDQHPTKVDKRKLRKVSLHHLSWTRVLTEAVMQKEFRGVADPDQAWILGELIRYLEHPRSGAMEFEDMGDSWVSVRDAVRTGTLRASDKGLRETVSRFDALVRYASLQLGRRLGAEVSPVLSRKERADPSLHTASLTKSLVDEGVLVGEIKIPNTVGTLVMTADLRARSLTCHVDIDAPREGRPKTRVNWLLRQLKNAPDQLRVEVFSARSRGPGATELISLAREDPMVLLPDPAREPKSFRIALSTSMGLKRGRGQGAFIDSAVDLIDTFYADVMQNLKAWAAAPPRMRAEPVTPVEEEIDPPTLASTAYSSQDGAHTANSEVGSEKEAHPLQA
ncbi:hypothetical protein GCM10023169_26700 [Georgenia halophila]|uniref:Stress response protein n=1 Tax=Georgenia halophila TaxID=620889 RepID=A0ABP8LCL5_9MICO